MLQLHALPLQGVVLDLEDAARPFGQVEDISENFDGPGNLKVVRQHDGLRRFIRQFFGIGVYGGIRIGLLSGVHLLIHDGRFDRLGLRGVVCRAPLMSNTTDKKNTANLLTFHTPVFET